MNAKLTEMAQLRGAFTIVDQQVRQARAQGFGIDQAQYRGSGYPDGFGVVRDGWRSDYRRGGGGRGGRGW